MRQDQGRQRKDLDEKWSQNGINKTNIRMLFGKETAR